MHVWGNAAPRPSRFLAKTVATSVLPVVLIALFQEKRKKGFWVGKVDLVQPNRTQNKNVNKTGFWDSLCAHGYDLCITVLHVACDWNSVTIHVTSTTKLHHVWPSFTYYGITIGLNLPERIIASCVNVCVYSVWRFFIYGREGI